MKKYILIIFVLISCSENNDNEPEILQKRSEVIIENNVVVGALSAIHQFSRIGEGAMIGGMSAVENDIIPYSLAIGNRAKVTGVNIIGLKRIGYNNADIREYSQAVDQIFTSNSITNEKKKCRK